MAGKLVSLEMPQDLIEEIKAIAKENSLTFSAQVRIILKKYIKEHRENEM